MIDNNNSTDRVLAKLEDIDRKLENLTNKTDNVEGGLDKIRKSMEELNVKVKGLSRDTGLFKEKFNNHERIIKDVLLPVMKLVVTVSKELNLDHGR